VCDTVDIRIRDHGSGIDADVLPTLFRRGARRPGSPGRGIGLHVAHRLAREMGGRLRLAPAPDGVGATFVLTLPATAGAVPCLGLSG
jgi:signal transduction histidine kinase